MYRVFRKGQGLLPRKDIGDKIRERRAGLFLRYGYRGDGDDEGHTGPPSKIREGNDVLL